jgi:ADP-heptose:LPS heptosyltransferase
MVPWGERLGYRYKKPRWAILAKVADTAFLPLGRLIQANALRNMRGKSFERILVIRLDHIGDLLCSFPAIRALRHKFSDAHISLLVGPWCYELSKLNIDVDEVIVYRAPWFDRRSTNKSPFKSLTALLAGAITLRRKHFDLAVDLRGDLRNILLMALSRIPVRVGYSDVGCGFLLTHPLKRNRWQHETLRSLAVVRALGCEGEAEIKLSVSRSALQSVLALLQSSGVVDASLLIVVHPFGGNRAKWWTSNEVVRVCKYLYEAFGASVILTGANEERPAIESARISSGNVAVNFAGKLSLQELIALIALADGVITTDTCTMHFAAALGTPQVVLFSSQVHPVEWAPIQGEYVLLHFPPACAGCELPTCPLPSHPCMSAIKAEHVIDALEKLMPLMLERAERRKGALPTLR